MDMTKKIATLISGMVLLLSAGCCETTYNCGAKPDPYGRDAYTLRGGISTNTRSVRLVSSSPGCPPAPCLPMSANIQIGRAHV